MDRKPPALMGKMTICGEHGRGSRRYSGSVPEILMALLALNCTLKRGGATSSTDKILQEVLEELKPG